MVALVSILVFIGDRRRSSRASTPAARSLDNVVFFLEKLPVPAVHRGRHVRDPARSSRATARPGRSASLLWPGFLVQKITTAEPDDAQLEVALAQPARDALPAGAGPGVRRSTTTSRSRATRRSSAPSARAADARLASRSRRRRAAMLRRGPCSPSTSSSSWRAATASSTSCSAGRRSSPTATQLQKLNKERSDLEPLVEAFARYRDLEKKIRDDEEALADPELRELAQARAARAPGAEARGARGRRSSSSSCRPTRTTRRTPSSRSGAARAARRRRSSRPTSSACTRATPRPRAGRSRSCTSSESATGGYKECIALVTGKDVYSQLRFEGGVHRVQRVPATETQGRIHTSTATVAVLPEADDVDVHIDEKDLEIQHRRERRPGRAGRQHDQQRRADPAQAERHHRQVPGRALAAQEQGEGAQGAAEPPARHRAREAGGAPRRRRAGAWCPPASAARRSAPTTTRRTA